MEEGQKWRIKETLKNRLYSCFSEYLDFLLVLREQDQVVRSLVELIFEGLLDVS